MTSAMKRAFTGMIAAAAVVVAVGACGDDSASSWSGAGPAYNVDCGQYSSCGTCTPVVGCGWCFAASGTGFCASTPAACPGAPARWTWDPPGCHVAADAGVASPDASSASPDASSSHPDASPADASPADASGAADADAAD